MRGGVQFTFNRIFTLEGVVYFVTARSKDSLLTVFKMEERNGMWRIDDTRKVARWITSVEAELEKAILETTVIK